MKVSLLSFDCTTAAGPTAADLWRSLMAQQVPPISESLGAFFCSAANVSARDFLVTSLVGNVQNSLAQMSSAEREQVTRKSARTLVLFASTKGLVEDWILQTGPWPASDPLTPVLQEVLASLKLENLTHYVVSNACASSLTAVALAREYLLAPHSLWDHALIVSGERVGSFVQRGFQSLKVLSSSRTRPFAPSRDGLTLGEATAAIWLSRAIETDLVVAQAAYGTEGVAVTRPASDGSLLKSLCAQVCQKSYPEVIVSHGTGTLINDSVEDEVYATLFAKSALSTNDSEPPLVTGTKWCVGHTLGASGALDLVAGAFVLRNKVVFSLGPNALIDPVLRANYVVQARPCEGTSVLISSLGFGGANAAVRLESQ